MLRLISRNDGLRVAVGALIRALPNIINITLIMLLFFLIFGVILVSQFKGHFFSCSDSLPTKDEIISKWDCLNSGGVWGNMAYNFDNVPASMVTLFVMATTAGWQDVLLATITATEINYVRGEYRSPFWTIFFMLFMIVGYFFFINLFIGVVVSTFHTEQDKIGGNDLLTEKQREWLDLKLLVLRAAPLKKLAPPKNRARHFFYNIMGHRLFEKFILVCIVLNTGILTLKWYRQTQAVVDALEDLNYLFTAIFLIEVFVKIMGLGPTRYFNDSWNRFDCFVAIGSFFSIILSAYSSLSVKGALTLIRSIRLLRILRLLK